jgi:hypothetical protein
MNYATPTHLTNCVNKDYEKFIKSKPCVVCDEIPAQPHHVDRARNNASALIPLCLGCHMGGGQMSYHDREVSKFKERARFEFNHGVDLNVVMLNLLAEFIHEGK